MKLSYFKFYNVVTLLSAGTPVKAISREYGVGIATIFKIKDQYLKCPDKLRGGNIARHLKMRGEKAPMSKLSEKQVIRIRKQLKAGATCKDVAQMYDLTAPAVYAIKTRKTWNHVK